MRVDYVKHRISNVISINKIVTIHYYELDKDFVFEGESHNFWEMVYVDAGSVEIDRNNETNYLKQGEIIFHKPKEFHTLRADKKTASNVFVISFVCSSEYMNFFKNKILRVPQELKKHISAILQEYEETFILMAQEDIKLEIKENPPVGSQQMIRTHLEQFLISLIRNEEDTRDLRIFPSKETMENHIVLQMIKTIETSVYKRISASEICESISYSKPYLYKLFKKATGHTLLDYIVMNKIKEAKKLIREGNYNFTQISDMLNFDNPHYFTRVFKRVTGITPREYKNSVANK